MPRLLFVLCGLLLFAYSSRLHAQDSLYVACGDTLSYRYTRIDTVRMEMSSMIGDTLPAKGETPKKNFLRKVIDYFGESSTDKTFEKKIDFTFIGGPNYSKETELGLGVMAAGLYRLDRTDSVTAPSDVSIYATASTAGFYKIGVSGNNIFRANRNRITYDLSFASQPTDYWGIGYVAGAHNPKSSYVDKRYKAEIRYLHQLVNNLYIGASIEAQYINGIKFDRIEYIEGESTSNMATGIGAILEYDSRDFIPNPYRGVYVSLEAQWLPKFLGSLDKGLWHTTFTVSGYTRVWKDAILASELYSECNAPTTPWSMLARMGGSRRMRGYYEGQYNDNYMITLQAEIRQRIWRRIGVVAWGGAGNVFHCFNDFKWDQTLPNYGIGLRWEFKKRVNIRIDYGFGKKTSGFLFNINEAF